VGSGTTSVIQAEGTGSGPAIYAEGASGSAIQADGSGSDPDPVIKANASGGAPAIQATGTAGRAIEAQSSSVAAIYATGSPGIDAVGSATNPAIHAVGSGTAPGIYVEASVSASDPIIAAAIYAEGSVAHAIYAKGTGSTPAIYAEEAISNAIYAKTNGSSPAIHAVGASYTSFSSPGSALAVQGGFAVRVRILYYMPLTVNYQITPNDHIVILRIDSIAFQRVMLPCPPDFRVQDGQMFIIKCWGSITQWFVVTQGGYNIAENRSSVLKTQSRLFENFSGYGGGVTYVFYGGIYYEMVDMPYNI